MLAWRITKAKWASTAFTGLGAAENPGRWNSEGNKAVYCAESRALAAWEILANVARKASLRYISFVAIPVTIRDDLIERLRSLPDDWDRKPPSDVTRQIGDKFLASGKVPVLAVPSATVKGELCFLLNPAHADFAKLQIREPEPFVFDGRAL